MVAGLGNIALAANHVAVTAEAISYLPAQGSPLRPPRQWGRRLAAINRCWPEDMECSPDELGCAPDSLAGIFLFFCAEPLAGLFSSDPEVIALAADMLRIVAVSEPLYGPFYCSGRCASRAGDSRTPFLIVLVGCGQYGCRLVPYSLFGAVWALPPSGLPWLRILCCEVSCASFCLQNQLASTCGPGIREKPTTKS